LLPTEEGSRRRVRKVGGPIRPHHHHPTTRFATPLPPPSSSYRSARIRVWRYLVSKGSLW